MMEAGSKRLNVGSSGWLGSGFVIINPIHFLVTVLTLELPKRVVT